MVAHASNPSTWEMMEAGESVQSKPWLNVTISQNEKAELKIKGTYMEEGEVSVAGCSGLQLPRNHPSLKKGSRKVGGGKGFVLFPEIVSPSLISIYSETHYVN